VPVVRTLTGWAAASGPGCEFGVITADKWESLGEIAVEVASSPALTVFTGRLYMAYQGRDSSLNVTSYATGSWGEPTQIGARMMSASPSLVVYDGRLWAFYQGPDEDGHIHYASSANGTDWDVASEPIPGLRTSESPGAAEFKGRLYVFHQGSKHSGQMWYTSCDAGRAWNPDRRIENVVLSDSPSPVAFAGRLFLYYQGGGNNEQLWYTSSADALSWRDDARIASTSASYSPSARLINGALFVASNDGHKRLRVTRSRDGLSWESVEIADAVLSRSPSIVAY